MPNNNCPRCESVEIKMVAKSPIENKWEVYGCNNCNYRWRSTEDLTSIEKIILDNVKINEIPF